MEDIFFIAGGSQICLNLHWTPGVVGLSTRGLWSLPLSLAKLGDCMNFVLVVGAMYGNLEMPFLPPFWYQQSV